MGLVKNRNFRFWVVGTTADSLTSSLVALAIPLAGFAVTGSAATAGVLAAVYAGLFAVLVLIGGVLVDHFDRRTFMILRAATGFVTWGVCGWLLSAGMLQTWSFAVLLSIAGVARGLLSTADNAALRSIVPGEDLPKAQGVIQAREAAIELAGAPIGGLLYTLAQGLPFLASALCALVLGVAALALTGDLRPRRDDAERARSVGAVIRVIPSDLRRGLAFSLGDRVLRAAVGVVMLANFAVGLTLQSATLQFVAAGIPPVQISLLFSIAAAGMLVGAIASQLLVTRYRGGGLVVLIVWLIAGCMVLGASLPSFWGVTLALALVALLIPTVSAVLQGYVAWRTPVEMQGRVISFMTLASLGLGSLTPLVAGALVQHGLFAVGLWISGAILAIVAVVITVSGPLRTLAKPSEWRSPTESDVATGAAR